MDRFSMNSFRWFSHLNSIMATSCVILLLFISARSSLAQSISTCNLMPAYGKLGQDYVPYKSDDGEVRWTTAPTYFTKYDQLMQYAEIYDRNALPEKAASMRSSATKLRDLKIAEVEKLNEETRSQMQRFVDGSGVPDNPIFEINVQDPHEEDRSVLVYLYEVIKSRFTRVDYVDANTGIKIMTQVIIGEPSSDPTNKFRMMVSSCARPGFFKNFIDHIGVARNISVRSASENKDGSASFFINGDETELKSKGGVESVLDFTKKEWVSIDKYYLFPFSRPLN